MIVSKIVNSSAEFDELTAKMKAAGYQWISLSNAGLPAGQARASYLPDNINISSEPASEVEV